MEPLHQPDDILSDRYRVVMVLGRGGMGVTYEAQDLNTGQSVAIKVVSLRQIDDWKVIDLLEREARVLAHINHPHIPRYIDYFQIDTPSDRLFCLVRERVEGQSLAVLIEQGYHFNEATVQDVTRQVLDILDYLHQCTPPIIHRDIKPQNIIRRADGQIFLVDFGSVQDLYRYTLSRGGTFVGTIGYMPPEQFRGQVTPASDLYALGATIAFLLTGRSPDELPQVRMQLDFRAYVQLSSHFAYWLDRMLAPAVEDRFQSAHDARQALQQERSELIESTSDLLRRERPAGTKITVSHQPHQLSIEIPPAGLTSDNAGIIFFAVIWNGFILLWTLGAATGGGMFALFSLPFWCVGLGMLFGALYSMSLRTRLEIDRHRFRLRWQWGAWTRMVEGKTQDLYNVDPHAYTNMRVNDKPVITCALAEGVRTHRFGSMLTPVEREWIASEVNSFLGEVKGRLW